MVITTVGVLIHQLVVGRGPVVVVRAGLSCGHLAAAPSSLWAAAALMEMMEVVMVRVVVGVLPHPPVVVSCCGPHGGGGSDGGGGRRWRWWWARCCARPPNAPLHNQSLSVISGDKGSRHLPSNWDGIVIVVESSWSKVAASSWSKVAASSWSKVAASSWSVIWQHQAKGSHRHLCHSRHHPRPPGGHVCRCHCAGGHLRRRHVCSRAVVLRCLRTTASSKIVCSSCCIRQRFRGWVRSP
jgi:hypothetical protein